MTSPTALTSDPVLLALLGGALLAHVGLGGHGLVKVGRIQYALQWLYALTEPTIIRLTDWLINKPWSTGTRPGRALLEALSHTSRFLPQGVVLTTEAASRFAHFLEEAEGPSGARLAVGPCVCQRALGRYEEPVHKDVTLLYGAEIHSHLKLGYRIIDANEATEIFTTCRDAGLVHTVDFCMQSGRWSYVVCNCDAEICILTRVQRLVGKFMHAGPAVAQHDPAGCPGTPSCGRCVQACIFDACLDVEGAITLDQTRCMGCGLCAELCPGAMTMARRDDYAMEHQLPASVFGVEDD